MLTTPNLSFDQLPSVVAQLIVAFEKQSLIINQMLSDRPKEAEEFINVSEASQIIKKAVPTIYFLAANKKLPGPA